MGVRLHSSELKNPREAWAVFSRKRAPRMLFTAVVLALVARVVIGDFGWQDVVAVAALPVIYPFGEGASYVYLLSSKLDIGTTRSHMEHHAEPQDLDLINFGPAEALAILLLAAPVSVVLGSALLGLLPGPFPLGARVSMLLTAYVLIAMYEWVHFLIHTAHQP